MRPLPQLTPLNEWFWKSGEDGRLRVQGCEDCTTLVHPPTPICPTCRSMRRQVTEVSGRATVIGFTVNAHPWLLDMPPPYAIAVVALEEDPSARLTTNIVGVDPTEVHIGQVVEVRFERHDDVWLPMFTPTGEPDREALPPTERPVPRRPVSDDRFESRAVVSGIGKSRLGRRRNRV